MKKINASDIKVVVLDFDGVLTDNKVYVDQLGREMVCCSRADGLACEILKKSNIKVFILSTERNPVVARRAEKINVDLLFGLTDKLGALNKLAKQHRFSLQHVLYVGNDVNDFTVMKACGFRASPADATKQIKKISNIHLKTKGGDGVVREIVNEIFKIDVTKDNI